MISGLTKNHHLHLLLLFVFFSILTFQETHSQESSPSGKLGYGSKCSPQQQKSKRILKSPQKIISTQNSGSAINQPSFSHRKQKDLVADMDSMNLSNNPEISSGFKRNQLRKKLRGIMERAKRQVGDEESMNKETLESSSRRGDNELPSSTSTTTATAAIMTSGSDDYVSSRSKSHNGPLGAEDILTITTIKSLVETAAPSSFQPSSTSTLLQKEESRSSSSTTPLTIESILAEKASTSPLPSFMSSSSHQPGDDDVDNIGHGQEDNSKGSSVITSEADSAMRVSITDTSRTEEIVSSTLTPAPADITTTTMTAAAVDQELVKVADKTHSDTSESIPASVITTPGSDSSSMQPVEMTVSPGNGSGEEEEFTTFTTSMPTLVSKNGMSLESSTTSSSSSSSVNFISSQGAAGGALEEASITPAAESSMQSNAPLGGAGSTEPIQMSTKEMTTQQMVFTTTTLVVDDLPTLFALKSTTQKPEESAEAQEAEPEGESNGMDSTNSKVEGITDIPHEDKSIVNNPPSTRPTTKDDGTESEPKVGNPDAVAVTSIPQEGSDDKSTTPLSVMTSSAAPQVIPAETESPSSLTTTTESTVGEDAKVVSSPPSEIPAETPQNPQMTSTTAATTQEQVMAAPASPSQAPAEVTTMASTTTTGAPNQMTSSAVEMTSITSDEKPPVIVATSPMTTTMVTKAPPASTTTAPSESPPPPPHTSEVSSPSELCDSSLSLECSSEAPHICICTSGLTWNESMKKCASPSTSQFNSSCTGNSSCSVSSFLVCRDSLCRCEDEAYQRWDENLGSCVSTAGTQSKCFLKEDSLGRQLGCVAHATCRSQHEGTTAAAAGQDEQQSGYCECNEGYENNWMGICNNSGNSLRIFDEVWVAVLLSCFLTFSS